jgi:prepilin-type N-terminal cleavage/methylation domain-containing protein
MLPSAESMLETIPPYIVDYFLKNHKLSSCHSTNIAYRQPMVPLSKGLSLLEMLVVLFILSIALTAVVPNLFSWRANMRLQGKINELLGDLESVKALAAKHNTTMNVQFVPAESRYRISYVDSDGNLVALKNELLPPELRIDSSHPDYTLTDHRLAFTSRGGATPGTLVLSSLTGKTKKIVTNSIGKIRATD